MQSSSSRATTSTWSHSGQVVARRTDMLPNTPYYVVSRGTCIGIHGSWAGTWAVMRLAPGAACKAYINQRVVQQAFRDLYNCRLTRQLGIPGDPPSLLPPDNVPAVLPRTDIPMHLSGGVAVFRGTTTGAFADWLRCAPYSEAAVAFGQALSMGFVQTIAVTE
ncbi:hypothetical protein NM688_g8164 [Phlebia brevispora]|uniref:Uncharacterized protein n=1 Tax=Phlebia brevispora TaxID=194682 RepID=A0ACC1RWH0_9APHY|nr:hypothetical protein NM688_g8164 [Phlebia brevispora]